MPCCRPACSAYTFTVRPLRLIGGGAGSLGHDLARSLIERAGLRNSLDRLLHLRIRFELHFETFLLAEGGEKYFLLDLALDPIEIFADVPLGVAYVVPAQVSAQVAHHRVVDFEALGDARPEIGRAHV